MHRTPFPKIIILFAICAFLSAPGAFSQTKATGDLDVTKCWMYQSADATGPVLASDGSRVFLGVGGTLSGARVETLALDGKKIWSTDLGGDISSNMLPLYSGLFLVTTTKLNETGKTGISVLRSLSKETGIPNWTVKLPDAKAYFLGGFNDEIVVVSKSGVIQSINAKSGIVKWKREIAEGFVADPAFTGDKVIVATTAKQVFVITLATGEIDLVRKTMFGITAVGKTAAGEIVIGDERGNVTSIINSPERSDWKFKTGGEISRIIGDHDHVLVTSHDNFVYSIVSKNGAIAWKKRLAGRVSQIANVSDKFALISGFEEHGAVLIDLIKGKVSGQIAFADDESIIAPPIVASELIFILTNNAAYAYSLSGCPAPKIKAATEQSPSPPF